MFSVCCCIEAQTYVKYSTQPWLHMDGMLCLAFPSSPRSFLCPLCCGVLSHPLKNLSLTSCLFSHSISCGPVVCPVITHHHPPPTSAISQSFSTWAWDLLSFAGIDNTLPFWGGGGGVGRKDEFCVSSNYVKIVFIPGLLFVASPLSHCYITERAVISTACSFHCIGYHTLWQCFYTRCQRVLQSDWYVNIVPVADVVLYQQHQTPSFTSLKEKQVKGHLHLNFGTPTITRARCPVPHQQWRWQQWRRQQWRWHNIASCNSLLRESFPVSASRCQNTDTAVWLVESTCLYDSSTREMCIFGL